MEESKIKNLVELREILEQKIKALNLEIEGMKILLEHTNEVLFQKSFKKAETIIKQEVLESPKKRIEKPQSIESQQTKLLQTNLGENLATLSVKEKVIRIVPVSNKKFNVNTSPFQSFLVDKILAKMNERDQKLVDEGKLKPDQVLSYEIDKTGDTLKEIRIYNSTSQREREIQSTARWTFEKMYEKITPNI